SYTDTPAWEISYLAFSVVRWILYLLMFFIYISTMFHWVKKRLEPVPETPVASASSCDQHPTGS
ncbi:MAG: hypothetical protein ACREJQ_04680, partial [bacterium]